MFEEEPDRLFKVAGIGQKRVDMIKKAWQEQKEIKNVMRFLQSNKVSTSFAVKIYKTIHRLLEYKPPEGYKRNSENPFLFGISVGPSNECEKKLGLLFY